MKKTNICIWIWISLFSLLMFIQCDGVDEFYQKYLDEEEKIYLGKNDSLIALPGIGRIQLKWYVSADPKIDETVIYWNMRQDSIVKPFHRAENGIQADSVFIENLPRGVYSFELINRNKSGYRSLISRVQTEVIEIPSVYLLPDSDSLFLLDGEHQTVNYSAFFSGVKAPNNISVKFSVDPNLVDIYNRSYRTSFKVMPLESYSLEATESTITAGENRTPLLKISFNLGELEAFKDYLLPLVLETSDDLLNKDRSVSYYYVLGSYPPGKVPRRLVSENVVNSIEMFSYLDKSLFTRGGDGKILSYPYDTTSDMFGTPVSIANNWTVQSVPFIASAGLNNGKLLITDAGWNIWVVTWDQNGSTPLPEPANFSDLNRYLFTGGANIFNRLIWTSRDDGMFGRWGEDGSLTYFKMNDDWTAYVGISARNFVNWGDQKIIFVYKGDFITIDANGNMWFYEYFANNLIGNPKKIGSGWDMYTHVTPFGDNLIARDFSGQLWEYQFDLRGYWALK